MSMVGNNLLCEYYECEAEYLDFYEVSNEKEPVEARKVEWT